MIFFLGIVILTDHGLNKLEAFARVQLPALVVSCKCDAPQRQINPSSIEQVGTVSGYETMQTSAASPDSQKKCVNMVLGMILRKNGLCPSLLLVLSRCTVSWRLLLCAFCLFFGKIGWRDVCFVLVASTTFLIYFFLSCSLQVRERGIEDDHCRLAQSRRCVCPLHSAAASIHSMPAHPLERLEFVKGYKDIRQILF